MRILVADAISEADLEPLRGHDHDLRIDASLTAHSLSQSLEGVEALIVRSTQVDRAAISAADRLGLIVRAGSGVDNIDTDAASEAGIYVCNVPGRNAVAVAELTMGLLLAIDRQIPDGVADLRRGQWDKKRYSRADGLMGKTMAIIGLGQIGLAVAHRAKAFGLTITALRRDDRPADTQAQIRAIGVRLVGSMDELLASADVVSIHVPRSGGTLGMVDATFLAKLRPGTILLNTARGDLIDESALLSALDNDGLRVGLDVFPTEPSESKGSYSSPLAAHPNLIGSHHIGASTAQAQRSVAEGTIEVIEAYLAGEVINCVNLKAGGDGLHSLIVRHRDRVGVLAQVFAVLRAAGLNVQQMQNQIFGQAGAAVATISVDREVPPSIVEQLQSIDDVLASATVTRAGDT